MHVCTVAELRLQIDSTFEGVPVVGAGIRDLCARECLTPVEASMIELAVVEAVNNAIEHGYQEQPGGRIEIHVVVTASQIDAVITDAGPPIDPETFAERYEDPRSVDRSALAEGGRGLTIMRGVFDELRYARRGDRNAVTMRKTRDAAARP